MIHSSYLEYFLTMKNTFLEGSKVVDPDRDPDKEFEKIFLDNLLNCIINAWKDHESYTRDSYLLTEEELENVWNESKNEAINQMLFKLSELGYIKTGINENGEIVYSVSDLGREYLSQL